MAMSGRDCEVDSFMILVFVGIVWGMCPSSDDRIEICRYAHFVFGLLSLAFLELA